LNKIDSSEGGKKEWIDQREKVRFWLLFSSDENKIWSIN
jgi:hypothetical protein